MSLYFPYKIVAVPHSVVSLGGRWSRPRPLLTVSVIGAKATYPIDGRLDTGADDTIFPESLAARIGVDLTLALIGQSTTANRATLLVRYAPVTLRLTDGKEQREWPAWVGFSPAVPRSLFGFADFLQFFTATFHGDLERVELAINRLYPGT